MKEYIIHYKSRYYPFEGVHKRRVFANNKKEIRLNWHSIIHTDEYKIVKIEEAEKNGK